MPALPPVDEMIRKLVGEPSVSSVDPAIDISNKGVAQMLANWAESLGFDVDVVPVTPDGTKVNVIAKLGRGEGGLLLAGHTDTVPWDDTKWQTNPFVATERDGKVFGLGTADMKSFLALALQAASRFDAGKLAEPLVIFGSADEECTMAGARWLEARGEKLARRAIIGEPTNLQPIYKHKGILMEGVTLDGQSGHSSNPALGRSALEGMYRVIGALLGYRDEIQQQHRDEAFQVPVPTLNLGRIQGGDAPNRICASCSLAFDLRVLPGMNAADERTRVHDRIQAAVAGTGLEVIFDTLAHQVEPFETARDAELVRTLEAWLGKAAGTVAFATEGPFFNALGMETVVMGPGSIDVAHQPNEYLPLDSIAPTIDLLTRLITRYCVDPV